MTGSTWRGWLLAPIVLAGLLAASSGPAGAHAALKSADPAAGSLLKTAPGAVTLGFSEALEPAFSSIDVVGADGTEADLKDSAGVPGDAKRLTVHLGPLKPGSYTVTWHATSVDTHKTSGSYRFTVTP